MQMLIRESRMISNVLVAMGAVVEGEVGVTDIIDELIPQSLSPAVRKPVVHPFPHLLDLPARSSNIPVFRTWAKVTPHNWSQQYLPRQGTCCTSVGAKRDTAHVKPLAAGGAVALNRCGGAIYVVTYAVRVYVLETLLMLYWIGKKINDLTLRVPLRVSNSSLNRVNQDWSGMAR